MALVHSSMESIKLRTPLLISGIVVKGFGRGGKLLGCPTANVEVKNGIKLEENDNGIYFGWAKLNSGIFKMVTSIGWNPQFENEQKTIEPHIIHKFSDDFYGEPISLVVFGYLRPEQKYSSMDDLIADIQNDIKIAEQALDDAQYDQFKSMLPELVDTPEPSSVETHNVPSPAAEN